MSDWMSEHVIGHVSLEANKELIMEGAETRDYDPTVFNFIGSINGENLFRSNKGSQGCFGR